MRVLILSADTWDMTDENTGEKIAGTTIHYLNKYRDDSASSSGLKPTKISADYSALTKIKSSNIQLPAYASIEVMTAPGAGGKAKMIIEDIELIESVELF